MEKYFFNILKLLELDCILEVLILSTIFSYVFELPYPWDSNYLGTGFVPPSGVCCNGTFELCDLNCSCCTYVHSLASFWLEESFNFTIETFET